jgi:hypothetical protein
VSPIPSTTPDNFEFEVAGSLPGRTLTGEAGSPILAEQIQTKVSAMDAATSDLDDRLLAVEAAVSAVRWRHITEGSQSGGTSFTVAVPAGYKMLRMFIWGDFVDSTAADLIMRVNGDTGNNHIWGMNIRAADGTTTSFSHSGTGTSGWRIGRWASTESNNSLLHIFPTNGSMNPSYLAYAHRDSTGAAGHQIQHGYGKYLGDVVVSSLTVLGGFADVGWVLEGYLSP